MAALLDTKGIEEKMQVDEEAREKRRLSKADDWGHAAPKAKASQSGAEPPLPGTARASDESKEEKEKNGKGKGHKDKNEDVADLRAKEKKDSVKKKQRDCDFRSGQKKMLILMVKQILRSAQHNRDTSGILLEVMIMKKDDSALKQAKMQTVA